MKIKNNMHRNYEKYIYLKSIEKIIRFAIEESVSLILNSKFKTLYLISHTVVCTMNNNLFSSTKEHSSNQSAFENHINFLVRAVAKTYIKARLHYLPNKNGLLVKYFCSATF